MFFLVVTQQKEGKEGERVENEIEPHIMKEQNSNMLLSQ